MATVPSINRGHPLLSGAMLWYLISPHRMGGWVMVDRLDYAHGIFVSTTGKPTWSGAQGRIGGRASLTLDGAQTQYLLATTPPVIAITLAAWVKVTIDSNGQEVCSNTSDTTILRVFNGAGQGAVFYVKVGGNYYGGAYAANIGTNWRHLCGTYDGETVSMYVDGVLAGSDATPSGPIDASPNNLLVGIHSALASFKFTGLIDDVIKWNRALSAGEVRQWYDLSRQRYPGILQSRMRVSNTAYISPYLVDKRAGSSRPFPFKPSSSQRY